MATVTVSTFALATLVPSGAAVSERVGVVSSPAPDASSARSETCRSARVGLAWYRSRHRDWLKLRGVTSLARGRSPRNCGDARYLANVWRSRSFQARQATQRWIAEHVLSDFDVSPGARAWHRAVQEAQRPYPGTAAWLLSCSASEGGWGRWVPNSQGSGVGGWLQFHPSTFAGFFWRARVDVARRGYIVPGSAASWYSPLGQALAGAWGITHGMRHHWAGSGCW